MLSWESGRIAWSLGAALACVTSPVLAAEPDSGALQADGPLGAAAEEARPTAVIAVEPTRPNAPAAVMASGPADPGRAFFLPRIGTGVMLREGESPGEYGRFSSGAAVPVADSADPNGWYLGGWDSLEVWWGVESGGFALPLLFEVSYRADPAWVALGVGANVFTVDSEKLEPKDAEGTTGAGVMSPRASVRVGFEAGPILIAVQGEGQRRWRWGLPDRWIAQFGVEVGLVLQPAGE